MDKLQEPRLLKFTDGFRIALVLFVKLDDGALHHLDQRLFCFGSEWRASGHKRGGHWLGGRERLGGTLATPGCQRTQREREQSHA